MAVEDRYREFSGTNLELDFIAFSQHGRFLLPFSQPERDAKRRRYPDSHSHR